MSTTLQKTRPKTEGQQQEWNLAHTFMKKLMSAESTMVETGDIVAGLRERAEQSLDSQEDMFEFLRLYAHKMEEIAETVGREAEFAHQTADDMG